MYKHANNVLPPAINYLYIENCEVLITLQDRNIYFRSIGVILISTQKVWETLSARIWNAMQSKIEVNVSISKFNISLKNSYKNIHLN